MVATGSIKYADLPSSTAKKAEAIELSRDQFCLLAKMVLVNYI
jgi:hypothetical protein